jgi:hypothetical protein
MNHWRGVLLVLIVVVVTLSATLVLARSEVLRPSTATVPTTVSFQGTVSSNGQPFNGTGYFKFAIVNTAGSQAFWANDGSNLLTAPFTPTAAVPLSVTNGVFNVLLGDISQSGMSEPLAPAVFNAPDRAVRVWFDDGVHGFQQLSPDAPLASVPFAFSAQALNGLDGSEYLTHTLADTLYQRHLPNTIIVAPTNGDFSSIQTAIDSTISPSLSNPYLIIVAPGIYTESITLKPHVDVQGSGVNLTTITHDSSAPTVNGADHSELRSLTVSNTGGGAEAIGIANINASPTLRDLVVRVSGSLTNTGIYQAIVSTDSGQWNWATYWQSHPLLVNSRVVVSGGLATYGLYNVAAISTGGASTNQSVTLTSTLQTSAIEVMGGATNYGIANVPSMTTGGVAADNLVGVWLDLRDSVVSVSGAGQNYGVYDTQQTAFAGGAVNNSFGTWSSWRDSTITVVGSTNNFGLYRAGGISGDARVQHSQITANTATITGTGGAAYVAASQLSGGTAGGIALTCAGVYDENYAFFASTCP